VKSDDITEQDLKGCLGVFAIYPFVAAYSTFADGWVLSKLWAWHAVPLGYRPLHWHTCAVVMLAYLVFRNGARQYKDDRSSAEKAQAFVLTLVMPWMALLLGWWWS